jgi:hypothetical protein
MNGDPRSHGLWEASAPAAPTKPVAGNEPVLEALRAIVGPEGLLLGEESVPYSKGARYGDGRAYCVVRPASTDEVSRVVSLCSTQNVQVVPQGANTGLVGGELARSLRNSSHPVPEPHASPLRGRPRQSNGGS